MILEKLEGLSERHTLKVQRPWFSADGQRDVTLETLASWVNGKIPGRLVGNVDPNTANVPGQRGWTYQDLNYGDLFVYGETTGIE
ncbi:MAG: hypothetical protein EBR82_21515 [Caulobacteraceae bacterium]|nr:hypothetical protein [Caulobacteraceae bacterium]